MKTKVIFSPEDFKEMGQYVVRDSFPRGSKDYRFGLSVAFKLAWQSTGGNNLYGLVALTDGMITMRDSLSQICDYLNTDEVGFRPLEKEELIQMVKCQGNRFQ